MLKGWPGFAGRVVMVAVMFGHVKAVWLLGILTCREPALIRHCLTACAVPTRQCVTSSARTIVGATAALYNRVTKAPATPTTLTVVDRGEASTRAQQVAASLIEENATLIRVSDRSPRAVLKVANSLGADRCALS